MNAVSDIKDRIRPKHCANHLHAGQTTSGVYTIFLRADDQTGQAVYCDMETDGGGWTVIQRRGQFGNPAYYFYRNWTEYSVGFGDPTKEYWIGNNALSSLTSDPNDMELKVVLKNDTGETVSAAYKSFRVGNEEELFRLQLGEFLGPSGWNSLEESNKCAFSTFDRDNDNAPENCAVTYRGAWWYNKCHTSNLNGLNLNGQHDSYADGIEWSLREIPVHLYHYSYPSVHMMIRPTGSH
ncbi:hypothetical protein V5799_000587 [Amblyomma americanum]|uniref:Fibrinogen C-terminal domain-containing protein n=1 Tax=Amblyomma americanum TaxID=6943 RepID=A0AAQ4D2M0_AMBAM